MIEKLVAGHVGTVGLRGFGQLGVDGVGRQSLLGAIGVESGDHFIDLSYQEQLVETGQVRALGRLIHRYESKYLAESANLREGLERAFRELEQQGLDDLLPYKAGNLAKPRLLETGAAINRLRSLKIKFGS